MYQTNWRTRRKKPVSEKEFLRRAERLRKISVDKNVESIKTENGRIEIKFNNGQIFKCSGPLVEEAGLL